MKESRENKREIQSYGVGRQRVSKLFLYIIYMFAVIITGLILSAVIPAAEAGADDLWSEEYYRAVDTSDRISSEEEQSLDSHCLEFMRKNEVDLAMLALTPDRYEGLTLEEAARAHYDECGFGYGPDRDGFMMIWDTDSDEVLIEAYGRANDLVSRSYLDFVEDSVAVYREEYGIYGPLYATFRMIDNYTEGKVNDPKRDEEEDEALSEEENETFNEALNEDLNEAETSGLLGGAFNSEETEAGRDVNGTDTENPGQADPLKQSGTDAASDKTDGSAENASVDATETESNETGMEDGSIASGQEMPYWYPADTSNFVPFHDQEAKRVVDDADIFTDEEEAKLEARLGEVREELSKDIVVFTDVSTYGLSKEVYAADFYDFNGYGIGPDWEGVCLLICMDPNDRGGWTCCSGPETRALFTETIANQIDDLLYPHLGKGEYYLGVSGWIENFRNLYLTGSPYLDEWAVKSKEDFTRFHDEEAPRVVDKAGLLSEEEFLALTNKAKALSETWQTDIVIYTSVSSGFLTIEDLTDRFYYFNGYGYGDDYNGLMLTVIRVNGAEINTYVKAFGNGKPAEVLTPVNGKRLGKRCKNTVLWGDLYEALDGFVDQTEHMFKTGRAPISPLSWSVTLLLELIAGLITGSICLSSAKKKMATPALKENADPYLVKNSLAVQQVSDRFINKDKKRIHDPVVTRSSSGSSSSGRSSYSSSYSGSSGRSHSGSGRSF